MKKNFLLPFIAFVLLFSLWEAYSRYSTHLFLILPAPTSILSELWVKPDRFLFHGWETLKVMIGGSVLALCVAFPFAWLMYLSKNACHLLQPIFLITQSVPMFALAPIMVVWFGWSYFAIAFPTALMIFFPLTMNLYQGLKATPNYLIEYFKSQQATHWQIFYKLQLPWTLPHIFAGLRISAAIAGIGAIAGEWAGAQNGLGQLMLESRRGSDLEITFAALLCLTLISLALYGMISLMERLLFIKKFTHLLKANSAICLIMLGITLSGCSQNEPNTKETRLVLDWLPNPNHIPLYVGIENGFFLEEGIVLKMHKLMDVGSPLPYLQAGNVELAISYQPSVQRANIRGAHFTPIGILIPEPLKSFIFTTDTGIKTIADLNDKTIGYCIDGTSTANLDYVLNHNQITPKEKKNVSFDLVSTLGNRQVDVIYGAFWNIECEQLRYLGIDTDYFTVSEMGYPSYYELIVVARDNSPEAQPEFVEQFQKALQKSIEFSQKNPEKAFEIYLKANPDKGDKMQVWEREAWMKTYPVLPQEQKIDTEKWIAFGDWLITNKIIPQ